MNWRAIRTIIDKDLKVVLRSKMIVWSILGVSVMMMVVMPLITSIIGISAMNGAEISQSDIEEMQSIMPAVLKEQLAGYRLDQMWFYYSIMYMFAPFFLIVPLMVSSVVAADSFVGERERKTMEALLHTPITNWELMLGKMLSSWLLATVVTVGGFVLYGLVANISGMFILGEIFFPNWMWVILVFWVSPAMAAMSLAVTVLLSAKVKTFQEAYQSSSIIVLPVVALFIGQMTGVLYFSTLLSILLGLGVWIIAGILLWLSTQLFAREKLLANL